MSKKKRKHMPRHIGSTSESAASKPEGVVTGPDYPTEEIKWWREAIEGLVVAIVLALLIRGFEAEAFVIPTGSMAPTLRGRHKDVQCDFCKYEYAAGDSLDHERQHGRVVLSSCPMCANPQVIEYNKARDASFTGDRILVNKFSYDPLGQPERFDVIVFKNPNDAKQNYIKRLCGLPGETIRLFRGDIYAKKNDAPADAPWPICRKPPKKIRAMLQPVHDTDYLAKIVTDSGVPPRWQVESGSWQAIEPGRIFELAPSDGMSWIRYRHIVPDMEEWLAIKSGQAPVFEGERGELITDFYSYNSYLNENTQTTAKTMDGQIVPVRDRTQFWDRSVGKNWVGDLALECDVDIQSDSGEFTLDLVEGGWHFTCTFDVASGTATLAMRDPSGAPRDLKSGPTVSTTTRVKGAGSYRVMLSNVDSELRLWVNDSLVEFGVPTTYGRTPQEEQTLRPYYGGEDDPGDLAPAGVGGRNLKVRTKRLRIHRDKYYVAVRGRMGDPTRGDYIHGVEPGEVRSLFRSPERWATTDLFDRMLGQGPRPEDFVEFRLEDFDDDSKDQFFPMGDNSPQSHDGRLWSNDENYVERQFLIGEAVLIYYPHPWHVKLPGETFRTVPIIVYPKFSRMGIIR